MKASQLVTYLQNEIRKHGDNEIEIIAYGDNEIVLGREPVLLSLNKKVTIKISTDRERLLLKWGK